MAVDSQAKRASVLWVVQPDSTIDQGDRQTVARVYRGVSAGAGGRRRRTRFFIAAMRRRV